MGMEGTVCLWYRSGGVDSWSGLAWGELDFAGVSPQREPGLSASYARWVGDHGATDWWRSSSIEGWIGLIFWCGCVGLLV